MEALGVIDGVDEFADGAPCNDDVLEGAAVDFFGIDGLDETVGLGAVVGIAAPAHADCDIVVGKAQAVVARGILHAGIGMLNQTGGPGPAVGKGLIQRFHRKRSIEMGSQYPAHHLAGEGVENDGEIGKSLSQPDVGDI